MAPEHLWPDNEAADMADDIMDTECAEPETGGRHAVDQVSEESSGRVSAAARPHSAVAGAASAYQNVGQNSDRALVEQHAPLVKRIAHHLLMRMPASVQLDDLVQSGMIGLLEAARKYDVSKGASFETYAGIRIRGAMLDEVRKGDWAPRSVHRKSRQVAEAVKAVEARTGTDARDHEVAEELGMDLPTYYAILQDASGSRLFSFDDLSDGGDEVALPGNRSETNGPAE